LDRPRDTDGTGEPDSGLGGEDPALARVEDAHAVEAWLAILPERQQMVMRLRFAGELRQWEIGELLGMSQMQVSRLIRLSLVALHQHGAEAV
jgi:RNA polymerase sigma-B factor